VPLTDMQAVVRCNEREVAIENLVARNGQATLRLSGRRQGYAANSPLELTAEGRQMSVGRPLFDALPDEWRSIWYKFFPSGEVDLDARLVFDGQSWQPELTIKCLNASFLYHKFPYRVERATGTLHLKEGLLAIDLAAFSGTDEISIRGEIANPGPDFTGYVTFDAPNLPFDDKLLSALPEASRRVMRSLNPRGTFGCFVRCWRDDPHEARMHQRLWGQLNHCSLKFDKFAYPVENIRGRVEMLDGRWTFTDLRGTNDAGVVECTGEFTPQASGGELLLRFAARGVALDEELREALDPRGQQVWSLLRPRGLINISDCEVRYHAREKRLGLEFRLWPQGETASIEPVHFPYRLERLQGSVLFRNGQVEIETLRAEHGRTLVEAKGTSHCGPDGWRLELAELSVDRLTSDRDVVAALPERLRRAVMELNPTGPMSLRGKLLLAGSGQPGDPLKTNWDLDLYLHQANLNAGVLLEDVRGNVRLTGSSRGPILRCRGDLKLDSLIYKGLQFTEVAGPLWIEESRVLLGAWAEPEDTRQKRRITGRAYGGGVALDAWADLGPAHTYRVQGSLAGADLARFTQENVVGRQKLQGKMFGQVALRGAGRGVHTLQGGGEFQLRNADIYELPLMVALLSILSIKPPDTTAFTESDVKFRVDGGRVYFDQLAFKGDAVTLLGNGDMNLDLDIQLQLYATVGPRELRIPLITDVMRGASQQVMRIHVGGTLHSPTTRAEAFPGVSRALKELEAGLGRNAR
jgi:hypothetical protein